MGSEIVAKKAIQVGHEAIKCVQEKINNMFDHHSIVSNQLEELFDGLHEITSWFETIHGISKTESLMAAEIAKLRGFKEEENYSLYWETVEKIHEEFSGKGE